MTSEPTIINMSSKTTNSQLKFNRRIREERGNHCEVCGKTEDGEQIEAHHVLDRRAFPKYAKNPEHIIVVCQSCHSSLTDNKGNLLPRELIAYGYLPEEIRKRLVVFLQANEPHLVTFIEVLRRGGPYAQALFFWQLEDRRGQPPESYIHNFEEMHEWELKNPPTVAKPKSQSQKQNSRKASQREKQLLARTSYDLMPKQYRETKYQYQGKLKGFLK